MSDPQALHVTRNVIPGKLGVDLHLHRVHIPLVDYNMTASIKFNDIRHIQTTYKLFVPRTSTRFRDSVCLAGVFEMTVYLLTYSNKLCYAHFISVKV